MQRSPRLALGVLVAALLCLPLVVVAQQTPANTLTRCNPGVTAVYDGAALAASYTYAYLLVMTSTMMNKVSFCLIIQHFSWMKLALTSIFPDEEIASNHTPGVHHPFTNSAILQLWMLHQRFCMGVLFLL
jgi:hypothetical protein